jgi:hypothetical protein
MIKRKGKNLIRNLSLNHKSFESKDQMRFDGGAINCWKDLVEGYKILPLHFQNKLDLKKIRMSKVLGQQESQFWDSHFEVSGKSDI